MSLAAAIKKASGVVATIEVGKNGQFDVVLDGQVIYSKHQTGRFPEHQEILSQLPK